MLPAEHPTERTPLSRDRLIAASQLLGGARAR